MPDLQYRPRSIGLPSQVLWGLRPRSVGFPSPVHSFVAGPQGFRRRSAGFPSQVRAFSVAGPGVFRPRSAVLPMTGDGFRHFVPSSVAGPRQNYGPGTIRRWTGDATVKDRERNGVGPGTVRRWTGDATVFDRGRFSAFCAFWRRRSPTKLQTWDATVYDRGQKPRRPGTDKNAGF